MGRLCCMQLKEGMIVRHPEFGPGRILLLSWTHAWVYFPDVPGNVQDAVKKLAIEKCSLIAAPKLTDPRLVYVPAKIVNGVLEFPKSTRMSHNEALAHFLSRFPKGFKDAALFEQELDYKRAASELFEKLLGKGRGQKLLAAGRLEDVAKILDDLFHATNIPATQEMIAVHDGLKAHEAAGAFLKAVLEFVAAPGPATFERLVDAVASLPAQKGMARVLTWPIVTLLPFFADPKRFIVLKPTMTKTAAERLFFDLAYDSRPNWSTYERTLAFATSLRELLKPHGARDFIDVQSFI